MAKTLAQLRTATLQTADLESASLFVDVTVGGEVDRAINDSIKSLHDLVIVSGRADDFLASTTVATAADTASANIGADTGNSIYMLRGLEINDGTNDYVLRRFNFHERYRPNSRWSTVETARPTHYFPYRDASGHYLRFWPVPDAVYTVTVWYIKEPKELTDNAHTIDYPLEEYEEYVYVDAAIKLKQKEEADTTALELRRQQIVERINTVGPLYDIGWPAKIADLEDYE